MRYRMTQTQVHLADGVEHEVDLGRVGVRLSQTVHNGRLAVRKPARSNYRARCILVLGQMLQDKCSRMCSGD